MAHYAFITDGIVTEVITGLDETELIEGLDPETWYGNYRNQLCKRTSYNSNIRGTYAGIGYSYNEEEDIFVTPQPYPSWIREGSFWYAPVPYPSDGAIYPAPGKVYLWNEETLFWDLDEAASK
jgi:hypothetical protein